MHLKTFYCGSIFFLNLIFSLLSHNMQEIDGSAKLVCVHDSARPLVTSKDVKKVCHLLFVSHVIAIMLLTSFVIKNG